MTARRIPVANWLAAAMLVAVANAQAAGSGAAKAAEPEVAQGANAAAAYRRAVALLREQFGDDFERMPEADGAGDLGLAREAAVAEPWRAATAAAAPALAQWQLAVEAPRCRFDPASSEPLVPEFLQGLALGLQRCRELVVARGLQAIAERDGDVAVTTVSGLLAHALHLQQEPGLVAWATAAIVERQAAALHEEIARALAPAVAERSRDALRRHLGRRGGIAAAAAAARIETWRLFDGTLAQMQQGAGGKAQLARDRVADVRRHFTALVDPILAVYERCEGEPTAEQTAEAKRHVERLRASVREQKQMLKQLQQGADLPRDVDGAEALGLLFASLLAPDLDGVVAAQGAARERLVAAARQ